MTTSNARYFAQMLIDTLHEKSDPDACSVTSLFRDSDSSPVRVVEIEVSRERDDVIVVSAVDIDDRWRQFTIPVSLLSDEGACELVARHILLWRTGDELKGVESCVPK